MFRRKPPMPPGGFDIADTFVKEAKAKAPKKRKKSQEFVQADGGDDRMHAIMLGKDDQFTTIIRAVPVKH
jgi:hypothetical protein